MRIKPLVIGVGVVLVGFLAACSSDSGSGTSTANSPYGDAIAETLQADPEVPFTTAQTDCLGQQFAQIIGDDRFQAAGIEPEDISTSNGPSDLGIEFNEADSEALAATFGECDIDVRALFLEGLTQGEEIPQEVVDCIEREVDAEAIESLLASTIVGNQEPNEDAIFEILGPCMEEIMALEGAS